MNLEVVHVPGCPNLAGLLDNLRAVTDLPIGTREVTTDAEAAAAGMNGSPTLLVNGHDPFAPPGSTPGLSCRLHRDEHGHPVGTPSPAQLRQALVLSTWRGRALPVDPGQRAAHRAVLRAFATTGRAPDPRDLDREALTALHDLDAIRLGPDGRVAVAYPFSSAPTRHRVRIGDRVEAYAMCAIDALGIGAMLGEDTRIRSVDPTTGRPVTVTTAKGHTTWRPDTAVVFAGADPRGGPSADCCCDYLNFFTDTAAARAWSRAHPHVPGQILTQADALALGARLFGQLLASNTP